MSRRNGRYFSGFKARIKKREALHNLLEEAILKDPLILNESGKLLLRKEKIVRTLKHPVIKGYTPDICFLYREDLGRYDLLVIDVMTGIGEGMALWDNQVRNVFIPPRMEMFRKRYFPNIPNPYYDFLAVTNQFCKIEVYRPRWFKAPRVEYYIRE